MRFILVMIVIMFVCGCNSDIVHENFSYYIDKFGLEGKQILAYEKNWFVSYSVEEVQLRKILNKEVGRGFSKWQRFTNRDSLSPHIVSVVDGRKNEVYLSWRGVPGDDEKIYVDVTDFRVVLVYGKTYGM